MRKLSGATVGLVLIALGAVLPVAQAQSVTFIDSRIALEGNDSVDWGTVGLAFTTVPNPFSVTSSRGLELTVSKASGPFSTSRQTSASDGPFSANFAPGDALITTTRQTSGPVTIAFSSPVLGVGTQVESFNNGTFNGTIEALDSSNQVLGSFSVLGNAIYGGRGDNTAPFVGVLSDRSNIASIRINGERAPGVGFAFNRLDIVRTSELRFTSERELIPEPDFSLLSAIAFSGFLGGKLLLKRNGRLVKPSQTT